jgi:predicted acetyltransferase
MATEQVEIRGCRTRAELELVVDLLDRAFAKTEREYFERHVLRDPTLQPEDTRILLRNGKILSSVQIFPRGLWIDGRQVRFGGIGNVGTDPDVRKGGFASMVMWDALARLRDRHIQMAILTTTINAYYERFGFRTVERELFTLTDISGSLAPGVRVFRREQDLALVRKIYEDYNRTSVGPVVRDDLYWNGQFDFCGEDSDKFLVLEDRGQIDAYIRAAVQKGELHILEFGARANIPSAFESLLRSVALLAPGVPVKMFLSVEERARIDLRRPHTAAKDTDMMVYVMDESVRDVVEKRLMKRNTMTFWLSDFF